MMLGFTDDDDDVDEQNVDDVPPVRSRETLIGIFWSSPFMIFGVKTHLNFDHL